MFAFAAWDWSCLLSKPRWGKKEIAGSNQGQAGLIQRMHSICKCWFSELGMPRIQGILVGEKTKKTKIKGEKTNKACIEERMRQVSILQLEFLLKLHFLLLDWGELIAVAGILWPGLPWSQFWRGRKGS